MVPYAEKRVKQHIGRFNRLYDDIMNNTIDQDWLKEVEDRDNIFRNMDCAKYYLSDENNPKRGKLKRVKHGNHKKAK